MLNKTKALFSGRYSKFVVALGGCAITGLETFYGTTSPSVETVVAGITALLVYLVPNASSPAS